MRGKDFRQQGGGVAIGITPAYAGKRALLLRPPEPGRDHPRVCGEKWIVRHIKPN